MSERHQVALKPPGNVSIAITGRCNLKCKYCFYSNEMEALRDLPTEKWIDFFRELGELKVMSVSLTGGEIFTRKDIFTLIDEVINNRMRYDLITNGTLINEEIIRKFDVGKRKLRLNYIQISIDGSTAQIHDKNRPGSFDRAVKGLRLLKKEGFPVTVRTTISKNNLYDIENIADFLLEDIGLKSFSTNEAMPIGAGRCQDSESISLSPAEKLIAMEKFEKLLKKYPERIKASAGPIANMKMYREMEDSRKTGVKTARWGMGYLTACGCVFSRIDILHDGTIVPCHMLPSLGLGKIGEDPIKDIWENNDTMKAMRDRRKIPMKDVPGCEKCEWNEYCNGSCPGLAHQLTGNFNRANPEDCYRSFLKGIDKKYDS